MKLIIDISEDDYEWAKQIAQTRNESVYCERQIIAISNGIPLDTVKAEMEKLAEQYKEYRYANTYISLCIKIIDEHIDKADMGVDKNPPI